MPSSQSLGLGLPGLVTLFTLGLLMLQAHALHMFIEKPGPKCFYEELPRGTLVVGHYKAEKFNPQTRAYETDPEVGVYISVDETFDNDHRVVSQSGSAQGRFTFSAADSGDHRLCFLPIPPNKAEPYFRLGEKHLGIRFELDMVIGETTKLESTDKDSINSILTRARDVTARLQDIHREQEFQRVREAEFRDQSEITNSNAVKWTLLQIVVLIATCAWQLTQLRTFFIKQKLT